MSDNIIQNEALPEAVEDFADIKETTPEESSEIFVPIKFNKEILNLSLDKAQELAQKGMKFDMISADYEALKRLAKADGKNVGEFVAWLLANEKSRRLNEITEKCGGDSEFAEHILKLEASEEQPRGFAELKESFPKINSIEDLPQSVVEAATLKGTLLLDEYLRYLHKQDTAIKESIKKQREAQQSAMGSLTNTGGAQSPETAEFLRGLWQK